MYTGSPLSVTAGGMSTLNWTTQNATSVTISGLGSEPVNGSASTPALTATTQFILTATGAGGATVSAVPTIQVTPAAVPQIVVFTASPQTINAGQTSSLCWQVIGATSISISNGVGSNLAANACQTVSPQTTTTYVLTATNATGQIQASVTVNVGSTQILSFTANPEFVPVQGESGDAELGQTTNATSVPWWAATCCRRAEPAGQRQLHCYPDGQRHLHPHRVWTGRRKRQRGHRGEREMTA